MSNKVLFTAFCPALNRKIELHAKTWYGHIMKFHAEMRGKRGLLKRAIEETRDSALVMRFNYYPSNKVFVNFQCVDFLPLNNFLRITFEIADDNRAFVTSAFAVDSIPKKGIIRP